MKTRPAIYLLFSLCTFLWTSCSPLAKPSLSDIRMSADQTGKVTVVSYTPLQAFCVYADVQGVKIGSVIRAQWLAVNVAGVATDTRINTSDYIYRQGDQHIYFKLATWDDSSWPAGSYSVQLFIDGVKAGEQAFTVQ